MTAFQFIHTADLHLGSPFEGVGRRFPENWVKALREAANTVFDRIVLTAVEHQVDFVTIAGDLFDSDKAAMSAQFALLRGFLQLEKAGIQVVISHGNHDFMHAESPVQWPRNVHVLGPCQTDESGSKVAPSVFVTTKDKSRVQVTGFSYTRPEYRDAMHDTFIRQPRADFAIGLYHGVVGDASAHENYCPTTIANLVRRDFDFWGLGHIHLPQVLQDKSPTILYPGNPQGRHSREQGVRGCRLVKVGAGRQVTSEFMPTSEIVWSDVVVDVEGAADLSEVLMRCVRLFATELPGAPLKSVTTVTLTGSTQVHGWLQGERQTVESLQDELMQRVPHVLVSQLLIETSPAADIVRLEKSEEFIGEFLRLCRHYLVHLEAAKNDFGPLLEAVFHRGNELEFRNLTDEEMRQMIERARRHVLKYVGEGDGQ